eukprot:7863002-Pyramimonas_sp.AAC.1
MQGGGIYLVRAVLAGQRRQHPHDVDGDGGRRRCKRPKLRPLRRRKSVNIWAESRIFQWRSGVTRV